MAYRNYRKHKRLLNLINEKQFFEAVAASSGYVDVATVRLVYNAMLDVMYQEIFNKGEVRLPAFADVLIVEAPAKIVKNHWMSQPLYLEPFHRASIRLNKNVRAYIKKIDKKNPGLLKGPVERIEEMYEQGIIKELPRAYTHEDWKGHRTPRYSSPHNSGSVIDNGPQSELSS